MLFVKAAAMGFCIAAPVGAIGMLCIQRSLSRGFCSGFATGIGAACADAVYGLLGALGVAGIVTALPMLTVVLKAAGGAFLVWMAWSIAREAPTAPDAAQETSRAPVTRDFLTTFALTLSNPLTILSFIAAFAALGPLSATPGGQGVTGWRTVAPMVMGVFRGVVAMPEWRDGCAAHEAAAGIHAWHFPLLCRCHRRVWLRAGCRGPLATRLAPLTRVINESTSDAGGRELE